MIKYKHGMKVYAVPTSIYSEPQYITVSRVGRVWVYFEEVRWRINRTTNLVDGYGYNPPANFYASESEYMTHVRRQKNWRDVRDAIDRKYSPPDSLSDADLEVLVAILTKK